MIPTRVGKGKGRPQLSYTLLYILAPRARASPNCRFFKQECLIFKLKSLACNTGNHVNSTAMEMPYPVTTRNNGNSGKSSAARCGRFLLLEYFATTYYGPFLRENPVKVNKSIILCIIHFLVTVSLVPNRSLLDQSWILHPEL